MPLLPHATEPSYRPQRIRTRIILTGAEPLDVMEAVGHVLQQLENAAWMVVRLDEHTAVHVRPAAVVGLIDLHLDA